jgi:hypothetical protein
MIQTNQIRQWIEHFNSDDYFIVQSENVRYLFTGQTVEGYIIRFLNTSKTQFTTKEFMTRFSIPYQNENNDYDKPDPTVV